jgi:hypothetical protein
MMERFVPYIMLNATAKNVLTGKDIKVNNGMLLEGAGPTILELQKG